VIQQRLAAIHARPQRVVANRGKIIRYRSALEPRADIRKIRVHLDWQGMMAIDDFRRLTRARQR